MELIIAVVVVFGLLGLIIHICETPSSMRKFLLTLSFVFRAGAYVIGYGQAVLWVTDNYEHTMPSLLPREFWAFFAYDGLQIVAVFFSIFLISLPAVGLHRMGVLIKRYADK